MMKKTVLFILILSLCFAAFGTAPAEEAADYGIVLNDGTPWVDYVLRENVALVAEKPDSPKDDFYLWANYDWLKSAEIAPGNVSAGAFYDVDKEITDQCIGVLTDPALKSGDAALVQHLYNAFLDWDARNAAGVAPLREITDRIGAVSSLEGLTQLMCDRDYGGAKFFRYDVRQGINNPDVWITDIYPISLLQEDSAEYRERTEQGDLYEAVYRAYLPEMLVRLGFSPEEATGMMTRAFGLEAELAESIMTAAEEMAPDAGQRINNEMDRDEAGTLCSAFPLLEILDARGYAGAQRFLVEQPAYLRKLDGIYREERLDDLKDYMIVRTTLNGMYALDRESFDLYMEMIGDLYGIEGTLPDEELACSYVRTMLPAQMSCAFFEKYDPSEMKEDIIRICREIIGCYREMLSEEDWLTEETRAKAVEKLDAIRVIAVCPEKWPDYSVLTLEGLGLYDCIREIGQYGARISASLADQPVDRDLWYCTGEDSWVNDILQANAMYDPSANAIIILRGILGGVFYREGMSDEELYGAIGLIIAHEISHAFDPTGAQYDATGRLNSWWTEADNAAFDARAQKLIDYYNGMTVFSGIQLPGKSVQGEAVADMGGMKCVLRLLEKKKENVDYRAFFEAVAKVWRSLMTWEAEYFSLMQDPHAPDSFRINSLVQQFQEFHETYCIREGDGMWLAPEDRVLVW